MTRKGRFEGYRADRKKAIVTLHKEDKIELLGNIEQQDPDLYINNVQKPGDKVVGLLVVKMVN